MSEEYRGHRIDAINGGFAGWHAYMDMLDVTGDAVLRTRADALAHARAEVDLAHRMEHAARTRGSIAAGIPVLRLIDCEAERAAEERARALAEHRLYNGG